MEKSTINLPHSNQIVLEQIITCFSQPVLDMNTLNLIFFQNRATFFPWLQQNYPQEALEFLKVYPSLQRMVLNIENILPKQLPLLKQMDNFNKIELTRKQVALLFLLSFFGFKIPRISEKYANFDVSQIFFKKKNVLLKFARCFINYLITIGTWLSRRDPILKENIIYEREFINRNDTRLENMNLIKLCPVNFITEGSLFEGNSSYCVDFANKQIGGGVLIGGCVQEEILFAVEPEAIIGMLFMEEMHECDGIGIFNVIKYSKYEGYRNSFEFKGNNVLNDFSSKIKKHRLIAIDASDRKDSKLNQVTNEIYQQYINRDIYKALAGFNLINRDWGYEKSLATGNWGCGIYEGIPELKFIEQWIAASYAGVERLDYYTFGDKKMKKNLIPYYEFIKNKFVSANKLYYCLIYNRLDMGKLVDRLVNDQFQYPAVYDFIN